MNIEINGKSYELNFGFKFLKTLNANFETETQGMRIDTGLINAQVILKSGDPIGLTTVLRCALSHNKVKPTDDAVYEGLENLIEENDGDLDKVIELIEKEMGKQPVIKAALKRFEKTMENNKEKKK